MITGKNHIAGELSARGNTRFQTLNAASNDTLEYEFSEATESEIEKAVEEAGKAFDILRETTGEKKALLLENIAKELQDQQKELCNLYMQETGLPEGRATGELNRTINQLRLFAELLREGSWVRAVINTAESKPDIRKTLAPLGPVAVFGASNFPFAFSTAGGDTASALAAGCPVIVKGHPYHAATSEKVAHCISKAITETGLPLGTFSHLHSSGHKVGEKLVLHEGIKAVGFTGSFKGGKSLKELAQKRSTPIPVYAEMGSVNPVVMLPGAWENDSEHWASLLAGSVSLGCGQFCTNPGLIIAPDSQHTDTFAKSLASRLENAGRQTMLHPNIKRTYESDKELLSLQKGVSVITDKGKAPDSNDGIPAFFSVSGRDFLLNEILDNEVFGPSSLLIRCTDIQEMESVVDKLEGQLTATVIGTEQSVAEHKNLISKLQARTGRIIFNGVPTGVEVCAAMHHGGPYPATTDDKFTSVGHDAIYRWLRPLSYQDWPDSLLPAELKNANPLGILRNINGTITKDPV
ncbi:aldehyde dehydrogenase (NADP(+)) [Robertkochia aurantiaca]|uniref:aldehyde dehydrogenase (NADP(+)) n=1 Tax=Robertkochia aurantiaca TaxID=2873700 RepID=UPI001CCA472B|nr:aldehyde dehydrogenase (NADP(+)) [Robertkochia sp. 3YJGBD-33]